MKRARVVLDDGAPELIAAVDQGKIAVSAASKLAQMPKDRQASAVRQVEAGEVKSAAIVNALNEAARSRPAFCLTSAQWY